MERRIAYRNSRLRSAIGRTDNPAGIYELTSTVETETIVQKDRSAASLNPTRLDGALEAGAWMRTRPNLRDADLNTSKAKPAQVLVIDDHPVVREVLAAISRRAFQSAKIYLASNLQEAIDTAKRARGLELVVLDLLLPNYRGIQALEHFRRLYPEPAVIVVSAIDDPATICSALGAGAAGFIPKTATRRVMIGAMQLVAGGGAYIPRQVLNAVRPDSGPPPGVSKDLSLTARQLDVLRLLARGLHNGAIGRELHISEHTVKNHLKAIYANLGVSSRVEALIAARRIGVEV